jgi:hypothetical protein
MVAANTYGRQVIHVLTNKSGGSVAKGDTVIVDTSNDEAFTTSTAGAVTGGVGIVEDATIANNAAGRVVVEGYASLVNVSASVTRGQYGKTHTVAKQAVASATRVAGTFCQFLTGGTTPSARIFPPDLGAAAGNVAADAIWDAAGDLAVGTGADTAAKLTKGATGTVPTAGASTLAYAFPPGYELNKVNVTSTVTISGRNEAGATTIVASGSTALDGSGYYIEVYLPQIYGPDIATGDLVIILLEGSTVLGQIGTIRSESANRGVGTLYARIPVGPSAASYVYTVKGWVTTNPQNGGAGGGAGGTGNLVAGYIRIVKA